MAPMSIAPARNDSHHWPSVLASLTVGVAFFGLWFWLLPKWLGFSVEMSGVAKWRWQSKRFTQNGSVSKRRDRYFAVCRHRRTVRRVLLRECSDCRAPRSLVEVVYREDLLIHPRPGARTNKPEDMLGLCRHCYEVRTNGKSRLRELRPSRFVTFARSRVGTSNATAATILSVINAPIAIEVFLRAH